MLFRNLKLKETSKKDSSINLDFCLKDTKSFRENLVCQQDNLHKSIIENALGFIVFYVEERYQEAVINKLHKHIHVPFHMNSEGSKIILDEAK